MEKLGVAIRLKLNGPPTIDNPQPSADIDEYFSTVCLAFRPNPKDGLIEVTKMQIVRHWAQEIGASHEDPEVDEEFAKFLALPLFAYDQQASIRELQAASEFVLAVAEEFFKRLDR
jgi:hypothetical protein